VPRPHATAPQDPSERFLAGLTFFAATVLTLAVPVVWDRQALDMFRDPKSALAFASWAVLAAVFAVSNLGGTAWRDPWWFAWGGALAGGAVSGVLCAEPARACFALLPLAFAALGWGAFRQLSERHRHALTALVVWAGVIEAALVLLFLKPSWQPESFALLPQEGARYAWIGTLGNPADAAVFLVLPALLAASRVLAARRHRPWNAAAAILMTGVILGTRTVTATLALTAGVLVLLWRHVPRPRRLPSLAVALAVTLAVFVATPLAQRVRAAVGEARGGGLLWVGSARFAAYAAAGSMVAARPATGVGFGLFGANSFRFQGEDVLAQRGRVLGLVTGFGETHNDILQYAAETGLVGLALAGAGLIWAVRRRRREDGVVTSVWPLAAAALVLALTQFPLHLAAAAAQWALLAALALPALPPPPTSTPWALRGRLLAAGLLVGAALVIVWQRYRTDTLFQQGKTLSASLRAAHTRPEKRAEVARAALANLVPKSRWLPYSWEAALIMGNLAVDAGNTRLAIEAFERASALADRPEVRFDMGMALLMAGDQERGMAQLVRAVQLNPAIFREIRSPELSRALRRRLDASGYGPKHAWMYQGTPAAMP
jgi:O-antigen ligase